MRPKPFFQQLIATMLISDYATAFFFARRTRVTLRYPRAIAFAILKASSIKRRERNFVSAITSRCRNLGWSRKNTGAQKFP